MASLVEQLVEMGFEKENAEAAVKATDNSTIDRAMDWLVKQQEGGGAEAAHASEEAEAAGVIGSYKCNDCGKTMRDENAMTFHASKTGHMNFAESTETIKPLTEEEKKVQAELLREKIKTSMAAKKVAEAAEAHEREKRRVAEGKLMLERKEKQKENEQLAAIAERKRAKEEEVTAKARVLEQIRLDKEARKAKAADLPAPEAAAPPPKIAPSAPVEKKDYKETTIQVRLPDGEVVRQKFGADEELAAVRVWLQVNRPQLGTSFALLQPFPRKLMNDEDMAAPLSTHGLVPSGSLVVTRM